MAGKGIMEEIREFLSQGMSSGEVIALGYAPGTIYEVQRRVRLGDEERMQLMAEEVPEAPVAATETESTAWFEQLESENAGLSAQVIDLGQEIAQMLSRQSELEELRGLLESLSGATCQSQERFLQLFNERESRVEQLDRRVKGLEDMVSLLGMVVYHLDVHHRENIHQYGPDPLDGDFRINDSGYRTLLQQLRQALSWSIGGVERRQQLGLPVRFKDLAQAPILRHSSNQRGY